MTIAPSSPTSTSSSIEALTPTTELRWSGPRPVVVDETLRDGLQSASVRDPPLGEKLRLLHAMAAIGVDVVSVGLPAAGPRAARDAAELASEIVRAKLPIRPTAAARTMVKDVQAIAEASERAGIAIEVYAFIGSSPIRQLVEGWDLAFLLARIREACEAARKAGLSFCLVTEDTTRTPPDVIERLFKQAIDAGASRLCLCDTVGHADPNGTRALVGFVQTTLKKLGGTHLGLDWHGHDDRGLALGNALEAVIAGVERVHGTALGVGERTGNVRMEHLLSGLERLGARQTAPKEAVALYASLSSTSLAREAPDAIWRREPQKTDAMTTKESIAPVTEPRQTIALRVNGERVEAAIPASRTLLEFLRYDLDLVATKQGCDKGDCGACTVIVDGRAVLSCLTLAVSTDGGEVITCESLAGEPNPDPLVDAFDRFGATQCGFCTGGMLMTAKALLAKEPHASEATIRRAISGNLCRCTGYGPIVRAIAHVAQPPLTDEPEAPRPGAECMPAPIPKHEDRR